MSVCHVSMTLPESSNRSGVSRRQLLRALAGGSAAAFLAGCQGPTDGGDGGGGTGEGSGGGGSDGESGGSRLRLAQAKSPVEFDPVVLNDVPSLEVAMMIFDPLYAYNEDGTELVPKVAAEMPTIERDGQRWIVLFDGDYQNHLVDADGKVGVRVDIDQASEILRLAADAVADLSYRDAEGDDVLRDLIDALEAEVGDE